MPDLRDAMTAVLLGTAVGDAIGLPREGLSARRAKRLFDEPPLRHRLFLGRGMCSDDTEHTCMSAQALLVSGGEPHRFARSLAWRLRWWFLALPAGVGMATAKACLKLWIGFPPRHSGVWSAGNGPAMRAAILGVYAWDDLHRLRELVAASTRLTHRDPAAEDGALAVALATSYAVSRSAAGEAIDAEGFLRFTAGPLAGTEMLRLIEGVVERVRSGASFEQYLQERKLTRGVSGYVNHTVPACLFCWLATPFDFRSAVERIIAAGGDADSTGAIVGALTAISAGRSSIPPDWLSHLIEWPRTVGWMERLARRLATDRNASEKSLQATPLFWPAILIRNVGFLLVVLAHGVRRIFPPY